MRRENLYLYTEFFVYIFHIEFFVLHHDLSLPDWKNSKTKAVLKKKKLHTTFPVKEIYQQTSHHFILCNSI